MRTAFVIAAAALSAALGVGAGALGQAPSEAAALAEWAKAYEVFSHPRCANCHVPEDNLPRWSGASYAPFPPGQDWRFHGMNVDGGASRVGAETLPCSTCHQRTNSAAPHGPPGAPVWALAPVEMAWWRKSSAEICAQIKDPARNRGRTLAEVADHVGHDALVLWGWEPGPGREPAPYTPAEIAASLLAWADAGAPCPPAE